MARDKLITVRIESEKRDALNQLAKSQNTDTASLLYDFINQCLDGRIDISLVTGKGQRIDNQLDNDRLNKIDNRIDGIETTTQRLAKRLDDWIDAIDDRLTDCDQGLSEKIVSLEHRVNALSSQLDRQKDRQEDRQEIDTDSQENDDMEPLLRLQREASIVTPRYPPAIEEEEEVISSDLDIIKTAIEEEEVTNNDLDIEEEEGINDLDIIKTAIEEEEVNTDLDIEEEVEPAIEPAIETAIEDVIEPAIEDTTSNVGIADILGIDPSNLSKWVKKGIIPKKHSDKCRFSHDRTKIVLI